MKFSRVVVVLFPAFKFSPQVFKKITITLISLSKIKFYLFSGHCQNKSPFEITFRDFAETLRPPYSNPQLTLSAVSTTEGLHYWPYVQYQDPPPVFYVSRMCASFSSIFAVNCDHGV